MAKIETRKEEITKKMESALEEVTIKELICEIGMFLGL